MDQSGRFDFWTMLLHTRAILPPPALSSPQVQMMKQVLPRWLILPVVMAVGVGVALDASNLPFIAVKDPSIVAVSNPAKQSQPW